MSSPIHGLFSMITDATAWLDRRRASRRTRQAIAALPRHIRKDIGWPDEQPPSRAGRRLWSL